MADNNTDRIQKLKKAALEKEKEITQPSPIETKVEEEKKLEIVDYNVIQVEEKKQNTNDKKRNYIDIFEKRHKESMQPCNITSSIHDELKRLAVIYNIPIQHIVNNIVESWVIEYRAEINKDKKKF